MWWDGIEGVVGFASLLFVYKMCALFSLFCSSRQHAATVAVLLLLLNLLLLLPLLLLVVWRWCYCCHDRQFVVVSAAAAAAVAAAALLLSCGLQMNALPIDTYQVLRDARDDT